MAADRGGRVHLTVVIPAFNEERRLVANLPVILDYLDARSVSGEILVVDDGSQDATAREAAAILGRSHRGRVLREPENRGKGHAVRRGVLEAAGRWVLLTDADLSTPIDEHGRLAAAARDHDLDVVIGSRALPDSKIELRQNPVRELMGKTFNRLMRLATGLRYRDTQCGFKLMDRERVRPLFERMTIDGFAFDVELLFLCERFGLAVREVPVVWRDVRGSKVSLVTDPVAMLTDVLRVRWNFRRGHYNPDAPRTPSPAGGES